MKFCIKDNSEWAEFVDDVCRSYGFDKKTCPIAYTLEGSLIGDGRAFIEHIKQRFMISITVPIETQKMRTKLNHEENEEKMRKKREGEPINKKIENILEKIKKKNVTELISDSFYDLKFEKGIPFYIRKTNILRDTPIFKKNLEDEEFQVSLKINRTFNVPDDEHEARMSRKSSAMAES